MRIVCEHCLLARALEGLNCVQVPRSSSSMQLPDTPRRLVLDDGGLPLPETDVYSTHAVAYMQ